MKIVQFFLYAFWIASLGEIISIFGGFQAHYFFKPAIVFALMGYYVLTADQRNNTFLTGLFFGWIGDVLLMFTDRGEIFFIFGLVAFLIGHLFYIFSFRQLTWDRESNLLPTQKVRYIFPILLVGTGLMVILYPNLGDMKMPVMVYDIVIMLMASYALLRVGRTSQSSFGFVLTGALLFMVSDSLLAINKFYSPFYMASIGIMGTYIAAQFMLVRGVLIHPDKA